jgi:hypothetical protein
MTAGSHYTDQQRREAVAHYVLLGNLTAVAKVTSIPASTLSDRENQVLSQCAGAITLSITAETFMRKPQRRIRSVTSRCKRVHCSVY